MKKLRVGVLGLIHDHVWANLEIFKTIKNAEITSVADVNKPLLEQARKMGIKNAYKTYDDLLSKEDLNAVLVYTENGCAADVITKAAERGLHVMTEKPMAATLEQAQRMYKVAEKNGIRLMVNYPTTWRPEIKYASKLAEEGAIGHIYQIWRRTGHKGPKEVGCSQYFYNWLFDAKLNGAGAYIDFCCYGVNICRSILGVAKKVTALGGTYVRDYLKVDDNAVLLLGYKKAMGILEGTWSQIGGGGPIQYQFVIRGSEGTIAVNQDVQVFKEEKNSWESLDPPPLKEGNQNGPQHFVKCILENDPFEDTVSAKFNVEVQAMLEAGLISMRENRTVLLKELF